MVDIIRAHRLCLSAVSLALAFGALIEVSFAATRLSDRQLDQVFAGASTGTGNNNGNGNTGFNNGNNNASSNNGNGNVGSNNGNNNGGGTFNGLTVSGAAVAAPGPGLAVMGQMIGNSRSRLLNPSGVSPLANLGALFSGALSPGTLFSRFVATPLH